MIRTVTALVLAACLSEPLPLPAEGETFWGLGNTGIFCYRPPCPWTGIFPIERDGSRGWPLSRFDQNQPPPLRASAADRSRIEAAFEEGGCVVAEAHFEGRIMVVRRLVGDCSAI
ncbi:hypothetical protein [Pelagibacterium lacus]|uniref:Uncharacterized protein n=1 Tax=Pelagibacterium lacus TaxID=2282655 RepID=A0A369WAR4_9HYPH|nr:hypothetical protein [Pelagibacterium lacus]RDE09161.1 hypothetical protein DVH29_08195 [Pelagibacterium lacus]